MGPKEHEFWVMQDGELCVSACGADRQAAFEKAMRYATQYAEPNRPAGIYEITKTLVGAVTKGESYGTQ